MDAGPAAPGRRSPAPRTGRRPLVLAAFATGLVVIVALGSWLFGLGGAKPDDQRSVAAPTPAPTRDPKLTEAWAAQPDHSEHSEAIGTWFTDTAVIRARVDRVVAYDVASGQQRWIFQPPDGQLLCAMSRDTGHGVGLVGYGPEKPPQGCATVAAIDLGTGETLWRHKRVLPQTGYLNTRRDLPQVGNLDSRPSADEVTIAGDVAVIREANAFVALGLRGDGQRWRTRAPAGCWPYSVTGAGNDLVLITDCEEGSWQISRADTRSGRPLMRAELGRVDHRDTWVSTSRAVVVLSLRPLVIRHPGDGSTSKRGAVVAFDDQGRRRATIPLTQEDGCELDDADFPTAGSGARRFANLPYRRVAIAGDTLVTQCEDPADFDEHIVAYSLDDGRRLWKIKFAGDVNTIGFAGGRLFAVIHDRNATEELTVLTLSADTGKTTDTEPIAAESVTWSSTHLFLPVGEQYLVSSDNTHSAGSKERPTVLLRHQAG